VQRVGRGLSRRKWTLSIYARDFWSLRSTRLWPLLSIRPDDMAVAGSGPLRPRVTDLLGQLIADDRATLVPHPIREAEVVYPNVVEAGAHGRGGAQRRSPAPFAMGDDVIAGAEARPLQHISQNRCRTDNAVVQQIGMRQMPGTWEMPAAGTVAHVLPSELCARTGVKHMRVAVKLTLEGLPIDQTNGPCPWDSSETAFRRLSSCRQSDRRG
jgi:hypothetical protein